MITQTLKAKQHLKYVITQMEWVDIDLIISQELRKQVLKNLMQDIKWMKKDHAWAFKIWTKYVKLDWMLRDEIQPNLGHETRVAKRAYTFVQPVVESRIPFFP